MGEAGTKQIQDEQEQFQTWLAHMSDYLEEFRKTAPPAIAPKLDFSLASLDAVESYILSLYANMDAVTAPSAARMVNLLSIYVGETIRKNGGGRWDIELADESFAFYKRPILRDIGPRKETDCPMNLVTASVDRRRGTFIRKVAEALVK